MKITLNILNARAVSDLSRYNCVYPRALPRPIFGLDLVRFTIVRMPIEDTALVFCLISLTLRQKILYGMPLTET